MTFKSRARRAGWLLVVAAFAVGIVSAIKPAPTSAYGLLNSRSIRMSSSTISATNTLYQVGFTTVTTNQTVGSIVIKFCGNSPIIGETTCSTPAGFDANRASLAISAQTGITGLSVSTAQGGANTNILVLTRTPSAIAAGTAATISLGNGTSNGLTNPSTTNQTFYARIILFPTAAPSMVPADENVTANDAGGIALSTANVLNVTAKVQETLIFCVWLPVNTNCAGGGTAIALGDTNGVLTDTTTTYTSNANFDLASNALGGVIVRLKGDTLKSGVFQIDPHGAGAGGACVTDAVTTSSEQFGLRVTAFGAGQTFGGAADNDLDDFECLAGNHKFDPTYTNTTYGQPFAKTVGATDRSTTNFELAAKAAGTTEAGIYTTTLQFIATATY